MVIAFLHLLAIEKQRYLGVMSAGSLRCQQVWSDVSRLELVSAGLSWCQQAWSDVSRLKVVSAGLEWCQQAWVCVSNLSFEPLRAWAMAQVITLLEEDWVTSTCFYWTKKPITSVWVCNFMSYKPNIVMPPIIKWRYTFQQAYSELFVSCMFVSKMLLVVFI